MFTLSCKVDAFDKYSGGATVAMIVNSNNNNNNNNQHASCPYCASKFKDNEELSKHIDRIHHGSGLLEGDSRRW
jgi:uncharacterized C2H2 Zn-finger protein